MTGTQYGDLFLFAAKAGSLEGYLFQRESVEPLANWIGHIEEMYRSLAPEVRTAVNPGLVEVLERTLSYGEKTLEPALRQKLAGLLKEAKGSSH